MKALAKWAAGSALAGLLGSLALLPISDDPRLLPMLLGAWLIFAAFAIAMRWRDRAPLLGGLLELLLLIGALVGGLNWAGRTHPGALYQRAWWALQQSLEHVNFSSAPLAPEDGTLVLVLAAAGLIWTLTDLIVVGFGWLAGGLIPLTFPAIAVLFAPGLTVEPIWLIGGVVAWCALASWQSRWRSLAWGRDAKVSRRPGYASSTLAGATAGFIAFSLLAGGVISTAIPASGTPRLRFDDVRTGPLQLVDPTIRLNEELRRPEDRPVLTYRTSEGAPTYLRSAALLTLSPAGWGLSDMRLQRGFPSSVPGLSGQQPRMRTQITIQDFETEYLPVPYAPMTWDAAGRWSFDQATMSVVNAARSKAQTTGLSYQVESINPQPERAALTAANAGTPDDDGRSLHVPADLPVAVRRLTNQITAGAATDGAKAIAIQNYLRDESRFSYSLNAPAGTGFEVLQNFLTQSRSGYCIHFAAAMATMARVSGIPARVAVGFTPGSRQSDGSYLVSSHDLHAWPELYFEGLGWVSFEPTVSVASAPSYTQPELESAPEPSPLPEPTIAEAPSPAPAPTAPDETPTLPADPSHGRGWLPWGSAALIVMILALLPRIVRRAQRSRRVADAGRAGVIGAWSELRASAIDLGLTWPIASPREAATQLSAKLPQAASSALMEMATKAERAFFANPQTEIEVSAADLSTAVAEITSAWRDSADARQRLLADWLPASLLKRK